MMAQAAQKKDSALSHPKTANIENSADENRLQDGAEPGEVAEYLADLLEGAKDLASKGGMVFLAYLIQVAVEEARIQGAIPKDSSY
jgi:hypothetical protein